MKRFHIGQEELVKILKVFAWSFGSALIALSIDFVSVLEVPTQYALFVPLVNTILYSIKEWISDNQN